MHLTAGGTAVSPKFNREHQDQAMKYICLYLHLDTSEWKHGAEPPIGFISLELEIILIVLKLQSEDLLPKTSSHLRISHWSDDLC